jgi:hypothetical protein
MHCIAVALSLLLCVVCKFSFATVLTGTQNLPGGTTSFPDDVNINGNDNIGIFFRCKHVSRNAVFFFFSLFFFFGTFATFVSCARCYKYLVTMVCNTGNAV